MKIDKNINPLPTSSAKEPNARAPQSKTTDSSSVQPQGVSVSLGSKSSQLRGIEANIASSPMVDSKKIAEIKLAISEGRFQINSSAIADGLINNVRDIISASQR